MINTYYKSKTGEILSRAEWQVVLDNFWQPFEKASSQKWGYNMPLRPKDDWQRFVNLLKLELVGDENA